MHKHSKLCITVRICVFFSQYFLKNKYHHCDWWQTKYSNLHLRQFTAAFRYSFHIYCTYCSLNLLSFFKLTCKSFKMIVVWVLVCFSFNNAKWAQVHMDLFFDPHFLLQTIREAVAYNKRKLFWLLDLFHYTQKITFNIYCFKHKWQIWSDHYMCFIRSTKSNFLYVHLGKSSDQLLTIFVPKTFSNLIKHICEQAKQIPWKPVLSIWE